MFRLSFIVPYYNVENYIEQCLLSLLSQDIPYEEYEIICVDDCSQDDSAKIVQKLQNSFSNIKLVKQERNHKQGSARNIGLTNAQGDYIWFVDSDDCIEKNCLGTLLEIIEKNNLDVLHFDYKESIDGEIIPYRISYKDSNVCSGEEFFMDDTNEIWWKRCIEVWRRIHKRSFLLSNSISFSEDVMYEDMDYSIMVMNKAASILHINQSPYIYRRNPTSVTHIKKSLEIIRFQTMQMARSIDCIRRFSDKRGESLVSEYIVNQSSIIRVAIKELDIKSRIKYCFFFNKVNINSLRKYISKRNWLALRYGIII